MISKAFHINFLGLAGVGKTTYIKKLKQYDNIVWTNKDLLSIVPYEEPSDPFIQSSFFKKLFVSDGNIIIFSHQNPESIQMIDYYLKMTTKYSPHVKTIVCGNLLTPNMKSSNYIDFSVDSNWKTPLELILTSHFKENITIKN